MTVKQNSVGHKNNKYAEMIQEMDKKAKKQGYINLDFLDQIPEGEIIDEPVPFPYGTQSTPNKWVTK
ncbi:MAG: hypothetical protein OXG56_04555 [Gammaproteobacteria bacterium]|nr:hypothetical protein [Gammaproteobacteria bacterium]